MSTRTRSNISPKDGVVQHSLVAEMINFIHEDLRKIDRDDPILSCPLPLVSQLVDQPKEVLSKAYGEMTARPYKDVPACWLRLYEDASLAKAAQMLEMHLNDKDATHAVQQGDWIARIVETLDKGMAFSGVPARRSTFESVFLKLNYFGHEEGIVTTNPITVDPPPFLQTSYPIARASYPTDFETFQIHMYSNRTPLIIQGVFDHWPATQRWQDGSYFLQKTLGGRRLVPVEIGESYTSETFSQAFMPFHEFMQRYVLNSKAGEVGYLAQHDLFAQIPALREDIAIPDFCYIAPPQPGPCSAAAFTAGLNSVPQLEEPLLNAWLGPKGTKTPLHTDPYHNILCQVVGYKYVRLYSPEQRHCLYPNASDESGVNMSNTSQVDVSIVTPASAGAHQHPDAELDARKLELTTNFPLFDDAEFLEAILAPRESLYIPLGWWHYVESLSSSISVSFWWN